MVNLMEFTLIFRDEELSHAEAVISIPVAVGTETETLDKRVRLEPSDLPETTLQAIATELIKVWQTAITKING